MGIGDGGGRGSRQQAAPGRRAEVCLAGIRWKRSEDSLCRLEGSGGSYHSWSVYQALHHKGPSCVHGWGQGRVYLGGCSHKYIPWVFESFTPSNEGAGVEPDTSLEPSTRELGPSDPTPKGTGIVVSGQEALVCTPSSSWTACSAEMRSSVSTQSSLWLTPSKRPRWAATMSSLTSVGVEVRVRVSELKYVVL